MRNLVVRAAGPVDPALGVEEARNAQPLRYMLQIVPIVELVLATGREIHCRDQDTLRHRYLLRLARSWPQYRSHAIVPRFAKVADFRPVPVRYAGPYINRIGDLTGPCGR